MHGSVRLTEALEPFGSRYYTGPEETKTCVDGHNYGCDTQLNTNPQILNA